MTIKEIFLNAIICGEIGKKDVYGVFVELSEFQMHFKDVIKSDYINTFLPAATIEKGRCHASQTKFLFRIKKATYRVHPDAIEEQMKFNTKKANPQCKSVSFHEYGCRKLATSRDNLFSLLNLNTTLR